MKYKIVNRIKEYRRKHGITQEELAERVGVSRQSIISIEQGRYTPSLMLALKMAEQFNTRVEVLFELEEV